MNNIDTLTKFCSCFGIEENFLQSRQHEESYFIKQGYNCEALKKIMYKNEMEDYIFLLLSLLHDDNNNEIESEDIEFTEMFNEASKRSEMLDLWGKIMDFYDDNFEKLDLIVLKAGNRRLKIESKLMFKLIGYAFAEFHCKEDNLIQLNFSLLEKALNHYDKKNILFEKAHNIHYKEDYINKYLVEKSEEIQWESTKGAKRKNELAFIIGTQLSYLIRIDKFLNNKDGITDIKEFPLKNTECKFIHDCLVYFGQIENKTDKKYTTSTPEKYLRTILKQSVPFRVNIPTNKINDLKSL